MLLAISRVGWVKYLLISIAIIAHPFTSIIILVFREKSPLRLSLFVITGLALGNFFREYIESVYIVREYKAFMFTPLALLMLANIKLELRVLLIAMILLFIANYSSALSYRILVAIAPFMILSHIRSWKILYTSVVAFCVLYMMYSPSADSFIYFL